MHVYMKRLVLIFLIYTRCSIILNAQEVEVIKYPQLLNMIDQCEDGEKIIVYNFWATWCKPCIMELPHFLDLDKKYNDVEVVFVSMDMVEQLENRVKPFVKKKNMTQRVVLVDETDFNAFISKVHPNWSGAIPATLMVNCRDKKTYFYEKQFDEQALFNTVDKIRKP
ncbi:MAG TPA: TlpA family protein disulfide reductase [Cytophagales bacterium]|nr:TlpA family protein disulfide reductase [Cytophagales bacterium]